MHFLGMSGLPRRIPDFPNIYINLNVVCSIGSMITIVSIIIFLQVILELINLGNKQKSLIRNDKK